MGFTSCLIPALVCLLACTGSSIHGRKYSITLEETIRTLNSLTEKEDPQCMELPVADVLAARKNTTERETLCGAAMVVRQVYGRHKCLTKRLLSKLDRNLSSLAKKTSCPVNKAKKSTLKDFLERLKRLMQEKYSKS